MRTVHARLRQQTTGGAGILATIRGLRTAAAVTGGCGVVIPVIGRGSGGTVRALVAGLAGFLAQVRAGARLIAIQLHRGLDGVLAHGILATAIRVDVRRDAVWQEAGGVVGGQGIADR